MLCVCTLFAFISDVCEISNFTTSSRFMFLLLETNVSVSVKVKVNPCAFPLTEHHVMEAYWWSGGIASLILLPRH
jgi:hypothetical protein